MSEEIKSVQEFLWRIRSWVCTMQNQILGVHWHTEMLSLSFSFLKIPETVSSQEIKKVC